MRSCLLSRTRLSRSSVVSPSLRRTSSRPTCLTKFRIAPPEGSNSLVNSLIDRPERTNSTICRRHYGGCGGCVPGIVDSSRECPPNPVVHSVTLEPMLRTLVSLAAEVAMTVSRHRS